MSQTLLFFFSFVAVLALIGLAAWLVRRFAGNRLGANTNRGRMPRLAVIDAAAVDGGRRLVLVRRDNIEHLLMIGGPTDIVVEPNIVRAMPGRDQMPPRQPAGAEPQARNPLSDHSGNWPESGGAPARRPAARYRPIPSTGPKATGHGRICSITSSRRCPNCRLPRGRHGPLLWTKFAAPRLRNAVPSAPIPCPDSCRSRSPAGPSLVPNCAASR